MEKEFATCGIQAEYYKLAVQLCSFYWLPLVSTRSLHKNNFGFTINRNLNTIEQREQSLVSNLDRPKTLE